MDGKKVIESAVLTAQLMSPQDANAAGNVHGGIIMKLIDDAAGAVAYRHARSNVVTASIDRLNFLHPIFVGDLVTFKASINMAGKTSMDIGVRVEAENLITGEVRVAAWYVKYASGSQQPLSADEMPDVVMVDTSRLVSADAAIAALRSRLTALGCLAGGQGSS